MLSSITPLGERAKGNSWTLTTSAYVVGSLLGGALLGLLASPLTALAGLLTPTVSLAVLALILLGGAAADRWGPAPPSIPRQVNENWLTAYRGWVYGFGFGTQLGFGLVTIITSWSMWTVVAAIILSSGGADAAAPWPLPLSSVIVGATCPQLGDGERVFAVALHAQAQRLDAGDDLEGVERRDCRPQIAQAKYPACNCECEVAEGLVQLHAGIFRTRLGQHRVAAAA